MTSGQAVRRRARAAAWLAALTAIAGPARPAALGAQRPRVGVVVVDTGDVVRVGVADAVRPTPFVRAARQVVGTVRRVAPDTLYLAPADALGVTGAPGAVGTGDVTAIPRVRIRGVEWREPAPSRPRRARELAVTSAVVGALAGFFAGDAGRRGDGLPRARAWRWGGLGAGAGLAGGALVGVALPPRPRWRVAWLPE